MSTASSKITRREFIKAAFFAGGAILAGSASLRNISYNLKQNKDPERTERFLSGIIRTENSEELPNVVIIFTDDLGYGDLGVYGANAIKTPAIDRMAVKGVRLNHFYSTAPLCSPSRAGFLSGRYPIRTMVTGSLYPAGSPMNLVMSLAGFHLFDVHGIPEDEVLLPELLQARGYKSGLLGKWHLGDRSPHLPNENGFDYFYGAHFSNDMNPYRIYRNNIVEIDHPFDQKVLTKNLTAEALSFIDRNASDPFFLYLAHPMPHEPIHASEKFLGRSQAGLYGDAVEEIDWSVSQILGRLDSLGLSEKTLVIFTSDNGPWWQGNPGFNRGRKNLPFEGGYRVPFIAYWPGTLPAGVVSEDMSMNFDLFPTILSLAGIPVPDDRIIDGKNILPLLTGSGQTPHETLFFYKGNQLVGVRHNKWKYLRRHMTDNGGYTTLSQGPFLFNLELDPNESYSLIETHPDIAQKLDAMIDEFNASIDNNIRGWL